MSTLNFDVTAFNAWFTAYVAQDRPAMAIAAKRFTPNFRRAFDAWLATNPATNPNAPLGPTYMAQYQQPAEAQAAALNAKLRQTDYCIADIVPRREAGAAVRPGPSGRDRSSTLWELLPIEVSLTSALWGWRGVGGLGDGLPPGQKACDGESAYRRETEMSDSVTWG